MNSSKGFSLVEAMLAAGVLSLIVTTLAGALVFGEQSSVGAGKRSRATELAEEGIEAVRSIRDQAFNELQYAQSGVTISSNTWAFLGEATTETIDEFTRTTTFADVCRNGSKAIVACPGTYTDSHTKQITVTVTWSGGTVATGSVSRTSYLSDWEASTWTQTDWSGGSGQSTWSDATKYDSDDTNVEVSATGQVTLKAMSGVGYPWWNSSYGYREKITFGTAHSLLNTGYTVSLVMDTRPANTNVSLVSGNDVRIVWQPTSGAAVELDRIGTVWNSATSSIDFRLQSDITSALSEDVDGSYYVYYDNAAAGIPPTNEQNVYYFADFYNRADSSTVGGGWTEWVTGGGNISIASNTATVVGNNVAPADAGIKQTFGLGAIPSSFTLNFDWTMPSNAEAEWTHYVNIGNSATMVDSSRTIGVGPGIYNGEGGHFAPNGVENVSNDLTGNMENSINGGPHQIKLVVNTTTNTYDYYRGGVLKASGQTYVTATTTLDQIRIATDLYSAAQPVFVYDNVKLTLDPATAPTVSVGSEQALSSTTFVDDTQAEYDLGSYSNTQYNVGSSWVDLTTPGKTAGIGTYSAKIQDAGAESSWSTLAWVPNRPTGKELPNSGASEVGYTTGNMAMTNNWGLYHLNESAGATSFADNSGNSRTGSCAGASCPTSGGAGKFSAAPDFDGTDDNIGLGTSEVTGSLLTLSAWVRPDAYGTDPYVISKANGTGVGNMRWMLGFNDLSATSAQLSFGLRTGSSTTTLNSSVSYGVGTWIHIVARYDGATMKLYANGAEVATTAKTGTISTTGTITTRLSGRDGSATSRPFNGRIDEVGIWNRALSPTEISDSYQRGALDLKFQVRSCNDAACAGETFIGPDGTAATYYSELSNSTLTIPSFTLTNVPTNRWFQYQATLITSNTTLTPELKSVSIEYPSGGAGGGSGYVTAGSLQSSAFNLIDASPVEILEWDQSIPSCTPTCTIKLQVRTAPDASGSPGAWTAWYGATGAGTYFTTNTGTRIPIFLNGNRWVQYRVELAGDGVATPILQETRLFYR